MGLADVRDSVWYVRGRIGASRATRGAEGSYAAVAAAAEEEDEIGAGEPGPDALVDVARRERVERVERAGETAGGAGAETGAGAGFCSSSCATLLRSAAGGGRGRGGRSRAYLALKNGSPRRSNGRKREKRKKNFLPAIRKRCHLLSWVHRTHEHPHPCFHVINP